MRTLRFAHKQESHSRRGMYERLQIVAFPSSYGKNVFAYSFKAKYKENGWDVYDGVNELKRLVREGGRRMGREREREGGLGRKEWL